MLLMKLNQYLGQLPDTDAKKSARFRFTARAYTEALMP